MFRSRPGTAMLRICNNGRQISNPYNRDLQLLSEICNGNKEGKGINANGIVKSRAPNVLSLLEIIRSERFSHTDLIKKMNTLRLIFLLLIASIFVVEASAQVKDASDKRTTYAGNVGVTTNGFSIVPSFSLNSPAILTQLSWKKNILSIEPDIRLTPNLKKGSMLLWFRYQPVKSNQFNLRIGVHPAVNFQGRQIVENGVSTTINQLRRFIAWELSPNLTIKRNWTLGVYYLQGNGLQKDGPRTTHFVTLNTGITNIKAGNNLRLALFPAIYYLYLDGYEGRYFTATAALSHTKLPYSLESIINQTFTSNLPGNKNFMWCLTLKYNFKNTLQKIK